MSSFNRRSFLGLGALTAAGLTGFLAACSSGSSGGQGEGGTVRAAFAGGGSSETLNYFVGPTALDFVRARLVHGALGAVDPKRPDGVEYGVLETIDVSDDLTTYTLRLRDGLTFTDGSPLTSADLLYSLSAPDTLQGLPFTRIVGRSFDLKSAKVEDELTVRLPARTPIADGRLLLCQSMLAIKDGTTDFTPDTPSCGPFVIHSYEPGRQTVLRRNPKYAAPDAEAISLKEIQLLSIGDAEARVNALRGGQVEFVNAVSPTAARTLAKAKGFEVSAGKPPYVSNLRYVMNLQHKPFKDERVRSAFRLAVDREAIVRSVYFGRAYLGNDVPALGFATYNKDLEQRAQDVERAKALLREAGYDGMSIELTVGPELTGMVETATLIIENLRSIGVDASLKELPAGQLYADFEAYQKLPFAAGYNPPAPFEPNHVPGNFPDVDKLVATARSATEQAERASASADAQRLLWEKGNEIIPVFVPTVDVHVETMSGVRHLQFPDLSAVEIESV
ncbi:ABC transporter substrate-binding protein [Streptomyces sp. PTY087I2]|uniref:ABC transporter substrate-binding protein n=1 Tax=Streptomyces sp. PTY087I2 TaxID=1819298 RepID=UPI00080B9422|nr:ABC transporter substrate-binding protein [Streptomyces sp. PTY087I2]OCC14049.1 Glutathione-binding protein GsiB precursor [Streptomyces sp. PTY087I2]